MADYLISADQEIPDWPVKTTFLGEVVTAIRLAIKSWFADVGFSTSDSILSLLFLFEHSIRVGWFYIHFLRLLQPITRNSVA